jgi:hypothetical protein
LLDSCLPSTVRTAENFPASFNTVPDNPATAVIALRCERVYGTFETVERMTLAFETYLNALVVIISANLALRHVGILLLFKSQPVLHGYRRNCLVA